MNLANRISITRILLIPLFIAAVVYYKEDGLRSCVPFIVFFTAVISDGVDGFIARRLSQKTELGAILDPVADKLLLITAFVALSFSKSIPPNLRLPAWLPILVISRDIIIVLGSAIIHVVKGSVKIVPTILGKVTTFFQMLTILAVLAKFPYSLVIWRVAGALTVISGANYILRGSRQLNENNDRIK